MTVPALILVAAMALDPAFARLAEEADVFARELPNLVGEETLRQRAVRQKKRFPVRFGEAALAQPPPLTETREIRSEFAYANFKNETGGGSIHEVRKLIEVDGKKLAKPEEARKVLVLGARSDDENTKRRLLGNLEKYLISGAATDFSLSLLLFRGRNLANYEFAPAATQMIGADKTQVYFFRQKGGKASFTVFSGKEIRRQPLEGKIWLRAKDGLPLRILLRTTIEEKGAEPIVDEGVTDYVRSPHGVVLPVSVVHSHRAGSILVAENTFHYKDFKRFSTESGITFTPIEADPQP